MCFVWVSEQTAIISLYNINWLVFIIETKSVYCAVRTEFLSIIRFSFFWNVGMAQTVSRGLLLRKGGLCASYVRVRFCGLLSATGTGFSPSTSVFLCQHTRLHRYVVVSSRTN